MGDLLDFLSGEKSYQKLSNTRSLKIIIGSLILLKMVIIISLFNTDFEHYDYRHSRSLLDEESLNQSHSSIIKTHKLKFNRE